MPCINLGNFSFDFFNPNICNDTPTTVLYGNSLNLGEILYTDASCTTETVGGYYSDGINVYRYKATNGILTITECPCGVDVYCISNTTTYDDNYISGGTHNGYPFYSGESGNYVIYYSTGETCWCVSTIIDGSCELFGKTPCTSSCPDLCDSYFSEGYCSVTTSTTYPFCDLIDFEAHFNCNITPTPTVTPTVTPTATPTPTPTVSNICNSLNFVATGITFTPTPTPTPSKTPNPTPTPTNNCIFSGMVSFNVIDDYIRCSNSKKFKDCFTGIEYYTSDLILINGELPIEGYVYKTIINNKSICATFIGLVDNISGIDKIELLLELGPENDGKCLECIPSPSKTPTPTPTLTPTPTPTSQPECPKCDTTKNLPQVGNSITINGVTMTASGTGKIEQGLFGGFLGWCLEGPLVQPGNLYVGNAPTPFADAPFSYTLNFNSPVNNVTIRIHNYNYQDPLNYESFTITTNLGEPYIYSCEYCCAEIIGNTINAKSCPEESPQGNMGSGIFTISSANPYTSLTISGPGPSFAGGSSIDICTSSFI